MNHGPILMILALGGASALAAAPARVPWLRDQSELDFSRNMYEIAAKIEADIHTAGKFSRPAPDKLEALRVGVADLRQQVDGLAKDAAGRPPADAAIYAQAVELAIRNDEWPLPMHEPAAFKCLEWGQAVADNLGVDPDFIAHHLSGSIPLGFYSPVDRSVQPYMLILPRGFDPSAKKKYRLVVFLHGSLSWGRMTTYIIRAPAETWTANDDTIQIRPFARGSNGYRWTFETDVWAAINDVKRRLPIDPDKIVLTGFSMGGGAWFIGLTNPGPFAAIVPMAGAGTASAALPRAADEPKLVFAPLSSEEVGERIDRIGSLAPLAHFNGKGVRWMMGAGGADPLLRGQEAMERVFDEAGVAYSSFVVPGVGHKSGIVMGSPEYKPFVTAHTRDPEPREIFFATALLRYSERAWVRVEGLVAQYFLSSIHAKADPKKGTLTVETNGINRFSIRPPESLAPRGKTVLKIDSQQVNLTAQPAWTELAFVRTGDRWILAQDEDRSLRKRPGLQGPINDAFSRPFLCVRPTGKPQDPAVASYVEAMIAAVEKVWSATMQATLPIKNDTDITPADRAQFDLVLFGDPGSNRLIAETLAAGQSAPPLAWDARTVRLAGKEWLAASHLPALIYPSPFAPDRYVVFNGSPMVRERLGSGRGGRQGAEQTAPVMTMLPGPLGDLAVLEVGRNPAGAPAARIVYGGFFDEKWALPQ